MEYKLLPRFRGRFTVEPEFKEPTIHPVPARVLDIRCKSRPRKMSRYDIEVEGSHNYLADGIIVHNSPETTSGGKALKFYASVRLDVRRIETLKDGTDAVGNRTRVKVVKNKMSPPFKVRRVRHPLRHRDQPRRQPDRPRRGAGDRAQVGRLVHLRRRPARPGQGERPQLPAGQPGPGQRDREADQGEARRRPAPRRRHQCAANANANGGNANAATAAAPAASRPATVPRRPGPPPRRPGPPLLSRVSRSSP